MTGRNVGIFVDITCAFILSAVFFLFAPAVSAVFIAAYVFLMLSVFMQGIPLFLSMGKQNVVYRCAYFVISIMYLLFQAALSFWGVFSLSDAAGRIVLISIVLFFSYGIAMAVSSCIFRQGHRDEMFRKEKRYFVEQAVSGIRLCKSRTTDMELIGLCDAAIDGINYSNVMSTQELKEVENQILMSACALEQLSAEHKNNDCKEECHKLLELVQERNIKMNVCR